MSEKEKISVIIPIYNVSDYVNECIESVLAQTYSNLEIILVDDGSTDGSGKICDCYAEKDNRIVVCHKENGGLSDARNYALDRCTGDYVSFVDGDDCIRRDMYEVMLRTLKKTKAQIAACSFERVYSKWKFDGNEIDELKYEVLSGTESMNNIDKVLVVAWNKLYERSVFATKRYPIGRIHEDEFIIHELFYECSRVAYLPIPFYFYRDRGGSILNSLSEKKVTDAIDALSQRVSFTIEKKWDEVRPTACLRLFEYVVTNYEPIYSNFYPEIRRSFAKKMHNAAVEVYRMNRDVFFPISYRLFVYSPLLYICLTKIRKIRLLGRK